MAWNGSDQTSSGAAPRSRGRISPKCASPKGEATSKSLQRSSPKKSPNSPNGSPFLTSHFSLLTSLLLLALVGAALWYFLRPAPPPAPKAQGTKHKAQIAAVTPAPARTNKVAKAAEEPKEPKKLPPQRVGEVRDGYVLLPSGRLHRQLGVITNDMNAASLKMPYEIFEHHCDNEIAGLLELKPGDMLMGTPRYNGRFKADFLASLEHPIVVYHDDSEYVKRIKEEVRQTKIEMKAALDRGEDIEQMMLDARKEAQRLAAYKQQLADQMDELILSGAENEKDVEDCVTAMNKMLEEKGIAPVNAGIITRRKLSQLMRSKEKGKQ